MATAELCFQMVLVIHNLCTELVVQLCEARRVKEAPGTNLLAMVDFLFSSRTVEQTFKPLVADWRLEYFDALNRGRAWKARWITARYLYSFIMAMSLSRLLSILKELRSVIK
jgi:hypothetical protein